ncbi:hypothetical protein [Laspinema olomoucense]|uniref:hypothetical protein n=1 Tax=Laspinema olomoucense TaxID=3231600 RepID=UPI0021BB29BE|nr:hypothetical protein [Laspinema sp. D3d]MCT7975218.1 hypothetical protein [Laspinema sp. D3d]
MNTNTPDRRTIARDRRTIACDRRTIAIAIGMITLGIHVWKAPDQLDQAIPNGVLVTSLVFDMIKKDPKDPPDDEGKAQ